MPSQLFQTIDQLSREKGIDAQIIVTAVEDAMLVATRKFYKSGEDLHAEFNKDTGVVDVYALKKVVETVANPLKEITLEEAHAIDANAQLESEVRIRKPTDVLGRIAAQTAKQVIYQKVREAERDTVYNEYSGRVGEVVNATVKRMEGPDLIVDIGKAEARLPRREQSRLEQFSVGDRLRAVIIKVEKSVKGPQVIVSRAAPELVLRLFEQEVPEIYDGTVAIKACAREAGERTKIAVLSRDRDVDSVGACVGMKGMRVESIRRELRGEKIDIVEYSEDSIVFATHALSPAKISRVGILDPLEKHLEVIVDDTQLSLAIGKKGQNVRLAAKLMGWRIDIKSEEEKRQEVEWQMGQLVGAGTPVSQLAALSEKLQEKLVQHDISTVERLGSMTPEELQEIPGIGPKMVEKIRAAVQNYWEGTGEGAETTEAEAEAADQEAAARQTAEAIAQAEAATGAGGISQAEAGIEPAQAEAISEAAAAGPEVAEAEEQAAGTAEAELEATETAQADAEVLEETQAEEVARNPQAAEAADEAKAVLSEVTGAVSDHFEYIQADTPEQRAELEEITERGPSATAFSNPEAEEIPVPEELAEPRGERPAPESPRPSPATEAEARKGEGPEPQGPREQGARDEE